MAIRHHLSPIPAIRALELEGLGPRWTTRCPAHDDSAPSLSVQLQSDGKILLHCHAGCRAEDIVAALGLTMADLLAAAGSSSGVPGRVSRDRARPSPGFSGLTAATSAEGRCDEQ